MLKKVTLFSIFAVICLVAGAQTNWEWPATNELKTQAQEKQAYYKVLMGLDDPAGALSALNWLYMNNPQLHPSIYQDGAKNIETLLEADLSKKRREDLEDSLLWMYDQRVSYFDDKSAIDRKAYAAFKLYYKNSKKYAALKDMYDTLFTLSPSDISNFNLTPYMTLGVYYYKAKPKEISGEEVINIYDKISSTIDDKISAGGDIQKLKKEQSKVDAMFNTAGLLNCLFIEEKIVPRMDENPEDINTIKKVFGYSLKAKCIDQPYFLRAAELLYEKEPSSTLAKTIADIYLSSDAFDKAMLYYDLAINISQSDQEKYEFLLKEAQILSKMGKKTQARKRAIEALAIKNEDPKALDLIGNMYFSSFEECKQGKSHVIDRSIFLAAYEMYRRSKNEEMMQQAKEQFPSIEEIFNEAFQEGDVIVAPCWIQMPVTLQRR